MEEVIKKHLLFVLISLLIIFVSCAPKKDNVRIKAGIIMKSGDIKNVARHDFLVTKADLIAILMTSKKEHIKDMKSIEKEIKAEMEYDNKINNLQNELTKHQDEFDKQGKALSDMYIVNGKIAKEILDKLKDHIRRSIDIHGKYPTTEKRFFDIKLESLKYGMDNVRSYDEFRDSLKKVILDPIEWFYKERLEKIYRGLSYENFMNNQIKELKEIGNSIDKLEPDVSAIDTKILELRNEINKLKNEINKLKNELKSKINARFSLYENKAVNDFQAKLKKASTETFKTNLNGEASLTIEKGQYYIFGIAQVVQSTVIWNLPVNIEDKEHYFELSNDNAFAIDDVTLASELLEALEGFEINQSN